MNTVYYFSPAYNYNGGLAPSATNNAYAGFPPFVAPPNVNPVNFIMAPKACTLAALNVGVLNNNVDSLPINPDAITITVERYTNGDPGFVPAAMQCSATLRNQFAGTTAFCSDTTHTIALNQGDLLSIGFQETDVSAPPNIVTVGLVCQ